MKNKRTARTLFTHETYEKDGKIVIGPRKKGPRTKWGQPGMSNLKRGR